jgi:ADP-ribose pyrophosphatase YjhB (NUDIX family)
LTESDEQRAEAIRTIERRIGSPEAGLPEEIFLFVSRITPMVNVDLLIQDERRRTLLTWRDDRFFGPGWHVPGGVIRYKERAEDRIRHVARQELRAEVEFDSAPVFVLQSIVPQKRNRAHAVSLLYRCRLKSSLDERQRFTPNSPIPGQWEWHEYCSENLIPEQREYAAFF